MGSVGTTLLCADMDAHQTHAANQSGGSHGIGKERFHKSFLQMTMRATSNAEAISIQIKLS
jgi:hypothetical protein